MKSIKKDRKKESNSSNQSKPSKQSKQSIQSKDSTSLKPTKPTRQSKPSKTSHTSLSSKHSEPIKPSKPSKPTISSSSNPSKLSKHSKHSKPHSETDTLKKCMSLDEMIQIADAYNLRLKSVNTNKKNSDMIDKRCFRSKSSLSKELIERFPEGESICLGTNGKNSYSEKIEKIGTDKKKHRFQIGSGNDLASGSQQYIGIDLNPQNKNKNESNSQKNSVKDGEKNDEKNSQSQNTSIDESLKAYTNIPSPPSSPYSPPSPSPPSPSPLSYSPPKPMSTVSGQLAQLLNHPVIAKRLPDAFYKIQGKMISLDLIKVLDEHKTQPTWLLKMCAIRGNCSDCRKKLIEQELFDKIRDLLKEDDDVGRRSQKTQEKEKNTRMNSSMRGNDMATNDRATKDQPKSSKMSPREPVNSEKKDKMKDEKRNKKPGVKMGKLGAKKKETIAKKVGNVIGLNGKPSKGKKTSKITRMKEGARENYKKVNKKVKDSIPEPISKATRQMGSKMTKLGEGVGKKGGEILEGIKGLKSKLRKKGNNGK